MNSKKFTIFIVTLFLLALNIYAGNPTFFPVSSAKVISLNGIYAAGSDGISSLTSNPAGLAYLNGRALEVSVFGRLGQQDYLKDNGILHRSFRDDDIGFTGGAYWNITGDLTVAVDYNIAYQYRANWPFARFFQGDSTSAVLAFDQINEYDITSINPSAALKLGSLSVGASVNIYYIKHSMAFYKGYEAWEGSLAQIPAYLVSTEEEAWAFGGTIGVQGYLSPELKFGAFVKSTVSAAMEGDSESRFFADVDSTVSKTSVSSDFELPWEFGVGFLYTLSDQVKINVDAVYSLWGSTQETQQYEYGNQTWNQRLSVVDSISGYKGSEFQLQYDNTFDVGVGLEYTPSSAIVVRFGYRFSQTQNSAETYNFLYPAVDKHWFSGGIGFWFEELYIDMALAYSMGPELEINQDENFFFHGKYSSDSFVPTVNVKFQF